METITVDDVIECHAEGIRRHGFGDLSHKPETRAGVEGVVGSANYYENVLGYSAAILRGITCAQHFPNGNKRAGWIACLLALGRNGYALEADIEDVKVFIERDVIVARISIDQIANQLAD